jgi:hypothetical protein
MSLQYKVETLLSRQELDQFEAFCREPGRKVDEAHEWMLGHGYTLSRSATHNWLADFKERETLARLRSADGSTARIAEALEAAEDGSPGTVVKAAMRVFQRQLFDLLASPEHELSSKDVLSFSRAFQALAGAERIVEELKGKFEAATEAMTGSGEMTEEARRRIAREVFGS